MKKLIIVGAGVSGITAGIYAARSGFDVTILERHNTFGGLSTAWSRKGYYFEGGMHWLTGSGEGLPMNELWKDIGALQENNPIENRDPLYTVYDGQKTLKLYRYLPDLKKELLEYAPEDKKMINKMCGDIEAFTKFFMPVFDLPGCKCKNPAKQSLGRFIKMLPAVVRVPRLLNESYQEYVSHFKNKNLRHLLLSAIGYRYNALSFIYTLGSFASGDCGYPAGGSVRIVKNMEENFLKLGGKITYRAPVEKVVIENGITKGVQTKDGFIPADAVIVTQDARKAVDTLFDPPLHGKWIEKMRCDTVSEQTIFISIGVKADLSKYAYCCTFPLAEPFEYAGNRWSELRIYNYAKYTDHSPEGCTSVTCLLIGDSYNYWKAAKEDGSYKAKKDELAKKYISLLETFIPEVAGNVEVYDVATPCTYERYCDSYEGSWMTVWEKGGTQHNFPQDVPGVKGLYFAGQRLRMPGGLPIAAYTGRLAVQYLCRDTGTEFV